MYLLWAHPETMIGVAVSKIRVIRADGPSRKVTVTTDSTWGFCHDPGNKNPDTPYEIHFLNAKGGQVGSLADDQLTKVTNMDSQCLVTIDRVDARGIPRKGYPIRIRTDMDDVDHVTTLLTNSQGRVQIPLKRGVRVRFDLEMKREALETVIPDWKHANWDDLVKTGSFVRADQRGLV